MSLWERPSDYQRVDGWSEERIAPHGVGPHGALYTAPSMGVRLPESIVW